MIQAGAQAITETVRASERLRAARSQEPHPLHPRPNEVISYAAELQRADTELARAAQAAGGNITLTDLEAIARKRASVDSAIARQASLAGRRLGRDREGSLEILNAIFN